ncbi:MAG: hypothetical protein ACFFDH_00540 [Promethearchaeota archaeon]
MINSNPEMNNTLNLEELQKLIKEINKPMIEEICITEKINGDYIYLLLEKYLCMNEKVFNLIPKDFFKENGKLFGVKIIKSDERFLKYFRNVLDFKKKLFGGDIF